MRPLPVPGEPETSRLAANSCVMSNSSVNRLDLAPGSCVLFLCGNFHADSAVTDKAARPVEYRLPAGPERLVGAIGIDPAEGEIEERTPGRDVRFERSALRLVPARTLQYSYLVHQ